MIRTVSLTGCVQLPQEVCPMKRRSGLPSSNQTDCWGAKQTGGLRTMSALGQKQTSRQFRAMSVILLKPDIHQRVSASALCQEQTCGHVALRTWFAVWRPSSLTRYINGRTASRKESSDPDWGLEDNRRKRWVAKLPRCLKIARRRIAGSAWCLFGTGGWH
jgi:hypothetical protein